MLRKRNNQRDVVKVYQRFVEENLKLIMELVLEEEERLSLYICRKLDMRKALKSKTKTYIALTDLDNGLEQRGTREERLI